MSTRETEQGETPNGEELLDEASKEAELEREIARVRRLGDELEEIKARDQRSEIERLEAEGRWVEAGIAKLAAADEKEEQAPSPVDEELAAQIAEAEQAGDWTRAVGLKATANIPARQGVGWDLRARRADP